MLRVEVNNFGSVLSVILRVLKILMFVKVIEGVKLLLIMVYVVRDVVVSRIGFII